MDTLPITGLDELNKHLDDLVDDPSIPLNAKLFDDVELQLTGSNIPPLIGRLLPKLTTILKQYTQDPAILASLAIKLLGPVSFTQILTLASEESLVQALDSPAPAANLLAMTVVHKAAASPADAAILSVMTSLIAAFLRRWLAAPQVEVGHKGAKVLGDVLDIDCELPPPPPSPTTTPQTDLVLRKSPGQGKMWRRIFNDKAMYTLLLDLCAGRHVDTHGDAHQLSLAQARILGLLPRLAALNFPAVSRSDFTAPTPVHFTNGQGDSAPAFTILRPGEGLLQFAALRMVDKSDVLMHLSLVDFFEVFVSLMRVTEFSSYKLDTVRAMVRQATATDPVLKEALVSLPERTVPEEADELRRWLQEIMPGETVRVALR
ncbi:hypothetical protein B0T22DRAFT_160263 [Podospora appendiculata]|uniref:DNA mismatch repair protein HSM3 N-terminal domain-containing protein n=1 Tax=Podospora appendiculata TaxID=314037 RepID=A0AAE0X9N9_9PEZI|nr:hypothetical protein B0T22DRAFT_160263 [Podospora appendiculata]